MAPTTPKICGSFASETQDIAGLGVGIIYTITFTVSSLVPGGSAGAYGTGWSYTVYADGTYSYTFTAQDATVTTFIDNLFTTDGCIEIMSIGTPVTVTCPPCWRLQSCDNPRVYYDVITDISALEGYVINGIVIDGVVIEPTQCWFATVSDNCQGASSVLDSFNTFFSTCETCKPLDCPVEEIVHVYPDPVKDFVKDEDTDCDIKVIQRFSAGYYSLVKHEKYGVTDCCTNYDLEGSWLANEIQNNEMLTVPDFQCKKSPHKQCDWLPLEPCELIGEQGGGSSIIGISGQALAYGILVELAQDGRFYANDPLNIITYQRVAGFAMWAVAISQRVKIMTNGLFTNAAWTLNTGSIYYAAPLGQITSIVPSTPGTISQVIGTATSSKTLLVDIKQPVIL